MDRRKAVRVAVVVAAGVAVVAAVLVLKQRRDLALATVADIEAQLAALDPLTRADVVARLTKDAAARVHALR
jgi:hypothetical protein